MTVVLFIVSFLASIAGAICGIGGGVIIKPVLDSINIAGVATINFLSGCTVIGMSCYSVGRSVLSGKSLVDFKTGTPLAIGAAVGGILGKNLFSLLRAMSAQPERVGGYQAVCLAIMTLGTLLYTVYQKRVKTHHVQNVFACLIIGLSLGVISSFLGIGGGPINLVVLYFFFSMPTKTAAQNSLYIILISQVTSFLTTLATNTVPQFSRIWLIVMVAGGIIGGITGRIINKRINDDHVTKLFMGLMIIIILISCYNSYRFLA